MAEEIKTNFDGKDGKGDLKLYANPLGKGRKFYGRFKRDVMSMENIVSRVQEKNPGTDSIILNTGMSYIKREILKVLKEGKAVNLLDLGELYIAAIGTTASDSANDLSEISLCVKFTASRLLRKTSKEITKMISELERDYDSYRGVLSEYDDMIRNPLTHIYFKYKDAKKIPHYEKENVLHLFARYNGNSYVHTIVDEMKSWEEII